MPYLWVALGGAIGSVARFGLGVAAVSMWGERFPWSTLLINVIGSFVIGLVNAATMPDGPMPASLGLRLFVLVGLCGGFTTFSSFSLQTLQLMRAGDWVGAIGNVLLSVFLCLIAVAIGHWAGTRLGLPVRSGASI